ncbi:MAG TPA: GFA family protein [Rhizomicrobium sp.]|nr:GFA family protein [Rhizomicrobium sp.]
MVEGSCHCGKVRIEIDTAPEQVTDCNCSICRRYGTLWAYYSPKQVHITEDVATHTYQWNDRMLYFHRCAECGCVTHWSPVDPSRDRMGINARLLAPPVLAAARVHHTDGASWGDHTR